MRIAYITSGAANMYCGSCLRDNTLAAALLRQGIDVQLIPTYTPIRTDQKNVSLDRVFLNGGSIYLQQRFPRISRLPFVESIVNQSWLVRLLSRNSASMHPRHLGELTVSMLSGTDGNQKRAIEKLAAWLQESEQPDLINFSNILIGGCIPAIREAMNVPILVTLQGDDIFLDRLDSPYRKQALEAIGRLLPKIDGFVVFSQFYAERMAEYLGIDISRFHVVPLGIDVTPFHKSWQAAGQTPKERPPTIGYLARVCEAKGLHLLVDAYLLLRKMQGTENVQLRIAGWLGAEDRSYAESQFARVRAVVNNQADPYVGELDLDGKVRFLSNLDLFSVPSPYREPKGLYVLEALAAGVPVVQPDHGAFPELLGQTGGGRLVRPGDTQDLAKSLYELLRQPEVCRQIGDEAQKRVHQHFNADTAAAATLEVYRQYILSND